MASLVSRFAKLNQKYNLIADGQKILIAVSGGIDSLVLCRLLGELRLAGFTALKLQAAYVRIIPVAVVIESLDKIASTLADWQIPFSILDGTVTSVKKFDCYACARERRKQLFYFAAMNHCDAVAFGHHLDDYLETGLMNLIYHGTLESLQPMQLMFEDRIRVIRPLLNIPKKHIRAYGRTYSIAAFSSQCIYQNNNQRQNIRGTIQMLAIMNRNFRGNLHRAVNHWNNLTI